MWAIIFFVAGAATLIYGIGLVRDARQCAHWLTAEGRIVTAEAAVVGRDKNRRTYAPDIVYSYAVEGKTYEGRRVTLVPRNYPTQSGVNAVLAQYAVGSTPRVYYDPRDPANAVLVNQPTGTEWAYPLGGILFLVVGCCFLKNG